MANDKTKVNVGKPNISGAIYAAPIGTALPASATEALDEHFASLGYVSEDGLTVQNVRTAGDEKRAWGGDVVYVTEGTDTETYNWTFIETANANVWKQVFGADNVFVDLGTGTVKIAHNKEALPLSSYVFDILLQDKFQRIVVPNGKITELGDVTYTDDELVGYEVTLLALADEARNNSYTYYDDKPVV
jgi:hypothetical protein